MSSFDSFPSDATPDPLHSDIYASLELEWYQGNLLPYFDWLLDFVRRHRSEIIDLAGAARDADTLLTATKRFIIECGSVHMAGELQRQLAELEREFWYRGEKGDYDRHRIQGEWVTQHAEAWRRHLLRQYQFVAEKAADEIVATLRRETAN